MRARQLGLAFVGYAVFYFVRKNIPIALPLMEKELHVGKAGLGAFLTAGDSVYGVSKLANGFVGDRVSARWLMAAGLAASAAMNGLFGLASSALVLGLLWMINGWFQGMGFPPCARVLSHWFAPAERGRMWGVWNASHMVGGAAILILAGWLGNRYGWRAVFLVPAAIAAATSVVLVAWLRDTPASLGLPPVDQYHGGSGRDGAELEPPLPTERYRDLLRRGVFGNRVVWLASIANFFVYTIRLGFLNWAPTFLAQEKHVRLDLAGLTTAGFELAGLLGSLAAGWLTDRLFAARRAPVCVGYMLACAGAIIWFWALPQGNVAGAIALLLVIGFLIYGPQFLVGVMVADQAGKHAAAAAIGLTGIFGYASSSLSGYGLGALLDAYGWNAGFAMLAAAAVAAAVPFAACWHSRPIDEPAMSR
jgi:OPA family glycerol-3-phosphate transporter-like MFS transporter/OPA family sugar phosphate sensor protein UhpC-like MFS transporter